MYLRQANHAFQVNDFQYVIIDTDVGGDDCQALILLYHLCKVHDKKLLGVSCCNGNAVIEDVVKNVLITQAISEVSCPIYTGNDCSLAGESLKDYFFGKDGLGEKQSSNLEQLGSKIDYNLVQKDKKSYKFIAESAIEYRNKLAIICIGPLSNLALAYHYNNEVAHCFSNVSIMGGSDTLAGLNSEFCAQFNFGLDPEAAYIVFKKFTNIIVASLDTSIIGIEQGNLQTLYYQSETRKGDLIRNVFSYMKQKMPELPLSYCDPVSVLVLFRPDIVTSGMKIQVEIEVKGKRTRGCSVVDYFSGKQNAYLIKQLDLSKLIETTLQSYKD